MTKKRAILLVLALASMIGSIHFGSTSLITESSGWGQATVYTHYTDWGRVCLSLVFGLSGIALGFFLLRNLK